MGTANRNPISTFESDIQGAWKPAGGLPALAWRTFHRSGLVRQGLRRRSRTYRNLWRRHAARRTAPLRRQQILHRSDRADLRSDLRSDLRLRAATIFTAAEISTRTASCPAPFDPCCVPSSRRRTAPLPAGAAWSGSQFSNEGEVYRARPRQPHPARDELQPGAGGEQRGLQRDPAQCLSAARACRMLLWSPLFTLDSGIERTISWNREFVA